MADQISRGDWVLTDDLGEAVVTEVGDDGWLWIRYIATRYDGVPIWPANGVRKDDAKFIRHADELAHEMLEKRGAYGQDQPDLPKHWRWMPYMVVFDRGERFVILAVSGRRDRFLVVRTNTREGGRWEHRDPEQYAETPPPMWDLSNRFIPDLGSAATIGCLEQVLLPAAWPGCAIEVHRYEFGHEVFVRGTDEVVWSSGLVKGLKIGKTLMACLQGAP